MNRLLLFFSILSFLFISCEKKPTGGDLTNSYWQFATLKVGDKMVMSPEGSNITLSFTEEELSGMGICNRYFADIEVEGVTLFLDGIGATEMACEGLDFENIYFETLSRAHSFTATDDELLIFSEGGMITYNKMSEEQVKADQFANGVGKLVGQFPELNVGETPHLYPIVRVDNPGNYPYKGSLLNNSVYQFFDDQTSEIWNNTGGDVLAVGKFDEFYICRVPGRYVSSDIAIFKLKNGQLHRSETVAWAWCDEGWCNQQDAWLKDIDADGRMDLIQRYSLTDDKGKVREERVTIMLQSESGTFKEDKSIQIDKSQFKMAKI